MPFSPSVFIDIVALYVIVMVWRNMSGAARTADGEGRLADSGADGNGTGRLFAAMLRVAALMLVVDAACWQLDGWVFPGSQPLLMALNSLPYLLQAFYCRLWIKYEILWLHGRIRMNRRVWTILSYIPFGLMLVLILGNLWTHSVFTVDANCHYFHGPDYIYALLALAVYVMWAVTIALVGLVRAPAPQQRRDCLSMIQFISLQIIGSVSEIFSLNISMTAPLIAFGLLMVYLNVQQRTAVQQQLIIARQKQELTKKQVSVMLSQIQPHFLYNALSTITFFCRKDPAVAEKASIDFTEFLRGNMTSLTADKPISFERELEHTKHYLALEKLRFKGLRVVFDIRATRFRIPTLTLQPIVENAVRYGVTKREEGGTVRISSREGEAAFVVTVVDDGVGFDVEAPHEDGRTHIGIQSVRERLCAMVGGTLDITSTPGVGTIAVITIPKE